MPKLSLITQAYYDANIETIQAAAAASGIVNFQPIAAEGGLLRCRGVGADDLPSANAYHLPLPLQDEGQADYRARIAVDAVGAFNAVKNGPKEIFHMDDERNLFDCKAASGWPAEEII